MYSEAQVTTPKVITAGVYVPATKTSFSIKEDKNGNFMWDDKQITCMLDSDINGIQKDSKTKQK